MYLNLISDTDGDFKEVRIEKIMNLVTKENTAEYVA